MTLIPLFINIRILDIIDILLVAFLLYELYQFLKGTAAIKIFFGIIAIYLMWKVVKALQMELLSEILGAFISVGFIALIIVFQPEIRNFLLMLGTHSFFNKKNKKILFWRIKTHNGFTLNTDPIIQACQKMAETKTGALIVLAQKNILEQFVDTGEIINAEISEPLLENIFYKNSPLHDGAVIIINNKIKAARCILPVSSNPAIPPRFGLRHRAATGVTEQSDAIAVIVSEQTGKISYCKYGKITSNVKIGALKNYLEKEFNE